MQTDPEVIRVVFSLIGKFFITIVFSALYTYTVELFPTETRSFTVGICSTSGRLGGVLSPFLANAVLLFFYSFLCLQDYINFLNQRARESIQRYLT